MSPKVYYNREEDHLQIVLVSEQNWPRQLHAKGRVFSLRWLRIRFRGTFGIDFAPSVVID